MKFPLGLYNYDQSFQTGDMVHYKLSFSRILFFTCCISSRKHVVQWFPLNPLHCKKTVLWRRYTLHLDRVIPHVWVWHVHNYTCKGITMDMLSVNVCLVRANLYIN